MDNLVAFRKYVGDPLQILPTVLTINGRDQGAIKLVRLMDEADGCIIAFVPQILMDLPQVLSREM
jgi:hypothetical protein